MARDEALAKQFFENGQRIAAVITVQRSAADIFAAWEHFASLPNFIEQVKGITPSHAGRTRWDTDIGGLTVSWDAEIINIEADRLIAWTTTAQAAIPNAGSIVLRELPFKRGTEVRIVIEYLPPSGPLLERVLAPLAGSPRRYLQAALFRFRQWMEAGEVATTKGQPSGRVAGDDAENDEGSHDERAYRPWETQT